MPLTPTALWPRPGSLARRLLDFVPGPRPASPPARAWRGDRPLRVLHLLSQQPAKTGSGVYLLAMTAHADLAGCEQRAVVGIPADGPVPEVAPLPPEAVFPVRFGQDPVPFPVPGMSDFMPYPSTRFSAFTPGMLDGYLAAQAKSLRAATRDFAPDLIHAHHLWILCALARLLFPHVPLAVSSHGTELRQLVNAPGLAPFVVPACSAVDRVFALHQDNKERIEKAYGIPGERVDVTLAGFREDIFRPDEACGERGCPDELRIVYAGKISAPKGVPCLLAAIRRVRGPGGLRVRLLLAGSAVGPEVEAIRASAAGLARVEFLGALNQEELARVFRSAHVFVLPSFFEGLPLVVLEALACGCRVVVSDLPGMEAWMPGPLCAGKVVERVPLPRLISADQPHPEDEPAFVENLALALERQLDRCQGGAGLAPRELSGLLAPMTWAGVFARILGAYQELAAA